MASTKSKLTEPEIGARLRVMVYQLTPDQTIQLLTETNQASDPRQLPQSIQTALQFTEAKLPRNTVDLVQRNLRFVVNDYSESPDFLRPPQISTIKLLLDYYKQFILNYVSILSGLLTQSKEDAWEAIRHQMFSRGAEEMKRNQKMLENQLENGKKQIAINEPSLVKYSEMLMEKLRLAWSRDVERDQLVKNGRQILVVRGPVILLSEVLLSVEHLVDASFHAKRIEEVHFVAQEIFYIDRNLEQKTWHGINILVIAKKIVCLPILTADLTWNLSGLSGEQRREQINEVERQLHGRDGLNGEHGGHVLFITNEFDGIDYLKIISNGGAGENGEDGKNGRDGIMGRDGAEMKFEHMKQRFPSFIASDNARRVLLHNLQDEVDYICFSVPFKITNSINNNYRRGKINVELLASKSSFYIHAVTKTGLTIECGFRKSGSYGFMLVKGQKGTSGTRGGYGGKGGNGGIAGLEGSVSEYLLQKVDRQRDLAKLGQTFRGEFTRGQNGIDGKDGRNGVNGVVGKLGRDVGFVEKKGTRKEYEAGYYDLVAYETKQENSVWSDYHEMYVAIQPVQLDDVRVDENDNMVNTEENTIDQAELLKIGMRLQEKVGSKPEATNQPINPDFVINFYSEYALKDELELITSFFDLQWWRSLLLK